MKKWKKVRTIKTYDYNGYYQVERDEVITPGGKLGEYSVIRGVSFSMIIPIDSDGNIYMVKQHRYSIDKISLEFPAGDMGEENALFAAKRELEEETSLIAKDWLNLGCFNPLDGESDAKAQAFIAYDVKKTNNPRKDPSDKDVFEVVKYSIAQIKAMIVNNEITDGPTITSFSMAFFQGELDKYLK